MAEQYTGLQDLPEYLLASMHRFLDDACILAVTDVRGAIVFANDAFCRISGYTQAELIGQNHRILKSGIHPDEFFRDMWRTISRGDVWRGEICNRAKSGELYWVDSTLAPVHGAEGRITHYVALRIDVTEARQATQRLKVEARMARLGRLTDGVLHDLNNLIGTALLVADLATESDERSILYQSLSRMAQLTRNMRELALDRPVSSQPFNLGRVVESAIRLGGFNAIRRGEVAIEPNIKPLFDCMVCANEGQTVEVILNLLTNAIEALRRQPGACITVRGSVVDGKAVIEVQDNGPGIDPDILPRLFAPYASTKGEGRGRGLEASRDLARTQGGDLVLVETPAGACFRYTIPLADQSKEPVTAARSPSVVVLMEDEAATADAISNALLAAGFETRRADSAEEALVLAEQVKDALAAAVLDATGTERNFALVGFLREIRAHLPVILTSASIREPGPVDTKHGPVLRLPKPFRAEQLVDGIREALKG